MSINLAFGHGWSENNAIIHICLEGLGGVTETKNQVRQLLEERGVQNILSKWTPVKSNHAQHKRKVTALGQSMESTLEKKRLRQTQFQENEVNLHTKKRNCQGFQCLILCALNFSSFFGIIFERRFPQPLSLIDEKVC